MQDSPGMYKLFLQLAKISVLVTHLPSINPSEAKPYRSRPRGGRSEVRNCLGWEGRTYPSMAPDQVLGLPGPKPQLSSAERGAVLCWDGVCPTPWLLPDTTGAAGSGLAWGSTSSFWLNYLLFGLLQKNGSIFFKGGTFRDKLWSAGEFIWGMIYLIFFSLRSSWALYPN